MKMVAAIEHEQICNTCIKDMFIILCLILKIK